MIACKSRRQATSRGSDGLISSVFSGRPPSDAGRRVVAIRPHVAGVLPSAAMSGQSTLHRARLRPLHPRAHIFIFSTSSFVLPQQHSSSAQRTAPSSPLPATLLALRRITSLLRHRSSAVVLPPSHRTRLASLKRLVSRRATCGPRRYFAAVLRRRGRTASDRISP